MVAPTSTMRPLSMCGQKTVLLRLVEAVDLVDEEQRAAARAVPDARRLEDALQIGDAGEDGADLLEGQVGGVGQQPGDGCLARAGRPPEDQRAELAGRHHGADRPLGAEQMVLADDLVEPGRAQPVGERARSAPAGRRRDVEEVGHQRW